jgi:hypothetical protein
MSGPKVFHIVTREEIIAICERLLARLDAAILEWQRVGDRNGLLSEADRSAVAGYREKWRAALSTDQFVELQKGVPELVRWLSADLERRFEQKLSEQTKRQKARRHLQGAAEMLLKRLEVKGITAPPDILAALKPSGKELNVEALSAAVSKGLGLLADGKKEELTEGQLALLDHYRSGTGTTTLQEWLSQQPDETEEDKRISQLERHIEEIRIVGGDVVAIAYQSRINQLRTQADDKRRLMLLDSLTIEFAEGVRKARDLADAKAGLRAVRAEISAVGASPLQELLSRIDSHFEAKDTQAIRALATEATAALDAEMAARVAIARRESVLRGLAALGYEVREGMATAWTKNGRVVLRKPASQDYGVELSGGRDVAKIQMRVVTANGSARRTVRDHDAETMWCRDVDKLRHAMSLAGTDLAVEKALPIGAAPLKIVPPEELGVATESFEIIDPKSRHI